MIPSAKQSIRSVVLGLFPWLSGVIAAVGPKGKGLAIRPAGGLLHLAGGPDDPGVVRVGDAGTAGTIAAAGNVITITNAAGETLTLTFALVLGAITVTAVPSSPPFNLATKSTAGSEKVTSA